MKKKMILKILVLLMIVGIGISWQKDAECAEIQTGTSSTLSGGANYTLQIGQEYWASTNGIGYVSFVTPSTEGYITVEHKNISVSGWSYAYIKNAIDEELAKDDAYVNGTNTFEFKSETGKRNDATLVPNTRYYIRIGKEGYSGNIKLTVTFRADANPNGKANAETIRLNTSYTRSIDSNQLTDDDYFKFTATSSGAHHFTINNSTNDSWLDYRIRKWNSDELVKRTNGYDMSDDVYKNNTAEYDVVLEAGQTYYLVVYGSGVGNYTFTISNQSVKSISMTSSKVMTPGSTFTLNPTISPAGAYNKTLKYSSSDSNVAYVNSSTGEVKAYRAGTAVITATATDGSGTKATCTIYVTPSKPYSPYWSKSTNTSIKVSWSSISGASGYTLYRSSGSKWVTVKNTKSTSCTVSKLKAGTGYKFRIRAYITINGEKVYSPYSDSAAFATTPKKNSIKSIKKLKAKKYSYGYTYRAKITWKKSSGANRYKLYYRAAGSSYKRLLGTYRGTSTTVSLSWSKYSRGTKTYTFYVVPVKNYGGRDYVGSYSKGKTYKFK